MVSALRVFLRGVVIRTHNVIFLVNSTVTSPAHINIKVSISGI
jgi:hypothetical protein